jgi:hypothetical protein
VGVASSGEGDLAVEDSAVETRLNPHQVRQYKERIAALLDQMQQTREPDQILRITTEAHRLVSLLREAGAL